MDPAIELVRTEVLSDNWYVLRRVTFRIRRSDGTWETQSREAYDRGNGATILLYDLARETVILIRPVPPPHIRQRQPLRHVDRGLCRAARQ